MVQVQNPDNYCTGMSWMQDVLKLAVNFETYVNECQFGLASYLLKDAKDTVYENCAWKRYTLDSPLWAYG
jgi:hypothetical protein